MKLKFTVILLVMAGAAYATPNLQYGNDKALEQAFNSYIKTGKAPNIITSGFVKFAYSDESQPIIQTTAFQETVISLEVGEQFTNVSSGDPQKWSYSVIVSGEGEQTRQHVLVKPNKPNIATNMVISTNKRVYNLKLVSTMNAQAVKSVSFWYPMDMAGVLKSNAALNDKLVIAKTPIVSLDNLNFSYGMTCGLFCHKPSFAPSKIFDDGTHTYLEFPKNINSKDLPALFIIENNQKILVNYRYKAPYFVVDKIFAKAALVLGVGRSKKILMITNKHYV